MMPAKIVYIIGFMGSGKTTTGRKLASRLGWNFIDLDKQIEKYTRMTIPELFSEYGEAHFRDVEADLLRKHESDTNTVISTGGGAPCHDNNMDYMKGTGLTIYLKLTPAQLKERLSKSKGERPLIKGLKADSLLEFIENKLVEREKWYDRAEIVIEGTDVNISLLHSLVKSRLSI
jgi:shikimate kinase